MIFDGPLALFITDDKELKDYQFQMRTSSIIVDGVSYEDSQNITQRFIDYNVDKARVFIGEQEIEEFQKNVMKKS